MTANQAPIKVTGFAVDGDSFELQNTFILDSGASSHVCNNPSRFKFERTASHDDVLRAGKTVYSIEAFGTVEITVQTPDGPMAIQLLNVALVPGFLTNTVSLRKFVDKGFNWDTGKQCIYDL